MTQVPRTEEGRVSLVANGGTINGAYLLPPALALHEFRRDLKALCERPTVDAYMAACRALHWREGQLRANGIAPVLIAPDAPQYPPEDYDFGSRPVTTAEVPPVLCLEAGLIDGTPEAGTLRLAADILESRA